MVRPMSIFRQFSNHISIRIIIRTKCLEAQRNVKHVLNLSQTRFQPNTLTHTKYQNEKMHFNENMRSTHFRPKLYFSKINCELAKCVLHYFDMNRKCNLCINVRLCLNEISIEKKMLSLRMGLNGVQMNPVVIIIQLSGSCWTIQTLFPSG